MSKVPKDKFLKELDKYQEENGWRGAKRYSDAEVKRWKERQPLSEEQKLALEKRDKRGFIVLVCGVSLLLLWAILSMVFNISF